MLGPCAIRVFLVGFEITQSYYVLDQRRLDQVVDFAIDRHGWARIHLKEPGFKILVEHYVESEKFKTALEVGDQRT